MTAAIKQIVGSAEGPRLAILLRPRAAEFALMQRARPVSKDLQWCAVDCYGEYPDSTPDVSVPECASVLTRSTVQAWVSMAERERSRSAEQKTDAKPPELLSCSDVVLDFDIQRHMELRRGRQPVLGLPMGTLPSNPQQNSQLGAPFAYVPEQLQLVGPSAKSLRSKVFADLSVRGFFVVSAVRHGFDFIIYEGDPSRHHGSCFVVIVESTQSICPRQLVLWQRLAASAHKSLLLAFSPSGGDGGLKYFKLSGEER